MLRQLTLRFALFLATSLASIPAQQELTGFLSAASRGERDAVAKMLDADPALLGRSATDDAMTALHAAAENGRVAVIALLLERGAPIDALAYNRFTPLHLAVMHRSTESVRRLVAAGADLERVTSFGRTALQIAASDGPEAIVTLLLERGANYDLHSAVCRDDLARVEQLAAEPSSQVGFHTMRTAIERGSAAIVQVLLRVPAAPEAPFQGKEDRLPLLFYATPHPDVLTVMLDGGFDPLESSAVGMPYRRTLDGTTALHHAASLGHVDGLRLLVKRALHVRPAAVDVRDRQGRTPLLHAAAAGQVAAMQLLTSLGADPKAVDATGQTGVHLAALAGKPDSIAWLGGNGVSLDQVDDEGRTAVARTAEKLPWGVEPGAEMMRALEMLHRLGCTVDLHAAVVLGDAQQVRELLSRSGAEAATAHLAAHAIAFDRVDSVAALVEAGLDPNARREHERTLLHLTAIRDAPRCARWLLEHGGDPSLLDAHGKLAREWLNRRSSDAIRAVLTQ